MAHEKTWQYASNIPYPVTDTIDDQAAWYVWWIKQFLAGAVAMVDQSGAAVASPQGLWTVAGSSDGVTGAMDGVDRWGATFDKSKIIHATGNSGARSWVVLANAGLGIWMTLDLFDSVSPCALNFWISETAPTGGAATAAPTVTEQSFANSGSGSTTTRGQPYCDSGAGAGFVHGALATDGSFLTLESRSAKGIFTCSMGALRLADVASGDSDLIIAGIESNSNSSTYDSSGAWSTVTNANVGSLLRDFNSGTVGWATFLSSQAASAQAIVPRSFGQEVMVLLSSSQLNGKFRKSELWIMGRFPSPVSYAMKGRVPDVYLTQQGIGDGAVALDENGAVELCQVGTVLVPAYTALSV